MTADDIATKIRIVLPDAKIQLTDLTGTADHWQAAIVSVGFVGQNMVQRHRTVMAALADEMKGPIHALSLDLRTPDEPST